MNGRMLATIVVIGTIALVGSILPRAFAQAGHGMDHSGHMAAMNMKQPAKTETPSLESIHSSQIPMVLMSIDKAKKALEAGDRKAVLAELDKAQEMLVAIHTALGKHVQPQFANAVCPIMGSPINPERVTKELTREYKGQKVAFCCAGCPATWDKLTDLQKQAKLAKAKAAPSQMQLHSGHNH